MVDLATDQAIQRNSTGAEKDLAGYLRALLWITENSNGNCRGFLLILDAFWIQAMNHFICIAGGMRDLPDLR